MTGARVAIGGAARDQSRARGPTHAIVTGIVAVRAEACLALGLGHHAGTGAIVTEMTIGTVIAISAVIGALSVVVALRGVVSATEVAAEAKTGKIRKMMAAQEQRIMMTTVRREADMVKMKTVSTTVI